MSTPPYFTVPVLQEYAARHHAQLLLNSTDEHGGGVLMFPDGRRQLFMLNDTGLVNPLGAKAAARDRSCGLFLLDHFGHARVPARLFPVDEAQRADGRAPHTREQVLQAALAYAGEIGWPVVLKVNRNRRQGLARLAEHPEALIAGCLALFEAKENVLIQPFIPGNTYSCAVFDGQVEYVLQRPGLQDGVTQPWRDATTALHPDLARLCIRICADLGLRLGQVDLIGPDLGQPTPAHVVLQVDYAPDLRHLARLGSAQQARAADLCLRLLTAALAAPFRDEVLR